MAANFLHDNVKIIHPYEKADKHKPHNEITTHNKVKNSHISHAAGTKNCSDFVRQDLEYRKKMNFNTTTWNVLFGQHAQHVNYDDCQDSRENVLSIMGETFYQRKRNEWVLPGEDSQESTR